MDEDLNELKREIEHRKSATPITIPEIPFDTTAIQEQVSPPDKAGELVEDAFGKAVVAQVVNNANVQKELLESADKVIQNKLNTIKSKTEQEDKKTHFNNKKGACECYGFDESSTPKWAVSLMDWGHNIMLAIWILFATFTIMPIVFIAKKITVIVKKTWVAILLAICVYLIVVITPIVTAFLKSKGIIN